ncbi:serine/threonine protein kinase [Thermosphaera chiliense]|uniref:Serine/threonine protein kinase n=1 Tax=Thermosphaera chiliense TaxID=3402707 RepID=A0A7M1UP11_9CREN|nr:serine/threonine protein kinase [Thermosphaera aggregans]QOR94005.1 serine/threonine protein kinase [Thermosphaera aggregans]
MESILNYLDDFSRQTQVYEFNGEKLVVKNYRKETGILKWLLINATNLTINIYPFAFQPIKRLEREAFFFREAPEVLKKPKVYVTDFMRLKLIREYVEGDFFTSVDSETAYRELGYHLSVLHRKGWALGDSKISNFVLSVKGIYIVDAEQATPSTDIRHYAWDLVVLASTMVLFNIESIVQRKNDLERFMEAFIEGYVEGSETVSQEVARVLEKPSFRALTYLLVPHPFSKFFLNTWKKHVAKEF